MAGLHTNEWDEAATGPQFIFYVIFIAEVNIGYKETQQIYVYL